MKTKQAYPRVVNGFPTYVPEPVPPVTKTKAQVEADLTDFINLGQVVTSAKNATARPNVQTNLMTISLTDADVVDAVDKLKAKYDAAKKIAIDNSSDGASPPGDDAAMNAAITQAKGVGQDLKNFRKLLLDLNVDNTAAPDTALTRLKEALAKIPTIVAKANAL